MISQHKYRISAGALILALAMLGAWLLLARPDGATAGAIVQPHIDSVPAAESAALPALRQPAELVVPDIVRRALSVPRWAAYGPNPALARAVVPPGGSASSPWHVIPAANGVCLFGPDGGTCQTLDNARSGWLNLQLVEPNNDSRTSPLPPPGAPVKSTIIGVVPDGVVSLAAETTGGRKVAGAVSGGMFKIAGTNLGTLSFGRLSEAPVSLQVGIQ